MEHYYTVIVNFNQLIILRNHNYGSRYFIWVKDEWLLHTTPCHISIKFPCWLVIIYNSLIDTEFMGLVHILVDKRIFFHFLGRFKYKMLPVDLVNLHVLSWQSSFFLRYLQTYLGGNITFKGIKKCYPDIPWSHDCCETSWYCNSRHWKVKDEYKFIILLR